MMEDTQRRYADTTTSRSGSGTWTGDLDSSSRSGSSARSAGRWTGGVEGARGLIAARWRWISLITFAVVATSAALSWSRTPTYVSSADVLVQPQIIAASTTPLEPDMGTELALAQSSAIRDIAASRLHVDPAGLTGLTASVLLNTHVVHFAYTAGDAREAMEAAQAFADAYVDYGTAQARHTGPRSPAPSVISPAVQPTSPASPNHAVDLGVALIVGLALGLGAAWLRDRFDDRPRSEADLEQATGLPVLAVIPRVRTRSEDPAERLELLTAPDSPAAAPFHDLRRLIRRLADQDRARTLLVTGVRASEHVDIAADLAVALAQSYRRVVLVDLGHGGDRLSALRPEPARHLVDGMPGLDADVSDAVADTVVPGLLMLTLGPDRQAGDTALRRVFRQLRATSDFVVVAGPDAATADIGGFVEAVDLTVLVVDSRHSTRTRVRAALARLNRFENCVIGTVLIGPGRRVVTERRSAPSSGRAEPTEPPRTSTAKEI